MVALLNTIVMPTLMKLVSMGAPYIFNTRKGENLIAHTDQQRVDPLVIVDYRASTLPYISDVVQSTMTSFIAFYLMAVKTKFNIAGADIVNLLGPLNPNRDLSSRDVRNLTNNVTAAASAAAMSHLAKAPGVGMLSMEGYRFGLPTPTLNPGLESFERDPTINHHIGESLVRISQEAAAAPASNFKAPQGEVDALAAHDHQERLRKAGSTMSGNARQDLEDSRSRNSVGFDGNVAEVVKDSIDLSVGKIVELTLTNAEGSSAQIPVLFRANTVIMPAFSLVQMLVDLTKNITRRERTLEWRSGMIDGLKDVLFATDLVRARVKGMVEDKSGTYQELMSRRAKSHLASVVSGSRSINTSSSIYILAKETADLLERESGGRLADPGFRAKLVENSYMMIMAVVDPQWETVVLYHAGIRTPTTVHLRDLKKVGKGKDVDMVEIIKLLQSGNAPMY